MQQLGDPEDLQGLLAAVAAPEEGPHRIGVDPAVLDGLERRPLGRGANLLDDGSGISRGDDDDVGVGVQELLHRHGPLVLVRDVGDGVDAPRRLDPLGADADASVGLEGVLAPNLVDLRPVCVLQVDEPFPDLSQIAVEVADEGLGPLLRVPAKGPGRDPNGLLEPLEVPEGHEHRRDSGVTQDLGVLGARGDNHVGVRLQHLLGVEVARPRGQRVGPDLPDPGIDLGEPRQLLDDRRRPDQLVRSPQQEDDLVVGVPQVDDRPHVLGKDDLGPPHIHDPARPLGRTERRDAKKRQKHTQNQRQRKKTDPLHPKHPFIKI